MKNEEIIEELISWGWTVEEYINANTWKHETMMRKRSSWDYYTFEEAIAWWKEYTRWEE